MSGRAIEIEGLRKEFRSGFRRRRVVAVERVDLEVEPGSVVAFVGPNGAGKTTTMFLLLGLLRPDAGRISILGEPPGSRQARRQLGFLSEIFHTYPFYTASQTLALHGRLSKLTEAELAERVPRELERLGLAAAADRKVGTFSKGMTQRLGLAQALLHRPALLLLDEPTTGLDPEGRRVVAEILREEAASGTTIFLSSHILSDVERSCDRVIMLSQGRIVLSERLASLAAGGDRWEIEVLGFRPEHAGSLAAAGLVVEREADGAAYLGCASQDKQRLLRELLDRSIEIGTVRRSGPTLEDLYLKHVGPSSHG